MTRLNYKLFLTESMSPNPTNGSFGPRSFIDRSFSGISSDIPITNLAQLPTVTKRSEILSIDIKRNPIKVNLVDGTVLYMDYDQYKKLKGVLTIGNKIEVVFQRYSQDNTTNTSKISSIRSIV